MTSAADSGSNATAFTYGTGTILGASPLLSDGGTSVHSGDVAPIAELASVPASLTGANVTLEAWLKIPEFNLKGSIIKLGVDANGWGFGIGGSDWDGWGLNLIVLNSAIAWHVSGYSFSFNTTYHIMVVRGTGGAFTCYVNGSSVATGTMSSPNTAASTIGVGGYAAAAGGASTRVLTSVAGLDNVAIYASALSSARVTAHYNGGVGDNAAVAADSPVIWLKLDEKLSSPRRATIVASQAAQRASRW